MKKYLFILPCAVAAALLVLAIIWGENRWSIVATLACVLLSLPFFLRLETRQADARRAVLLAAFTALSVAGRVLFTPFPFFKPVAAMVALSGAFFGGEFGFLCGALTALLSNFYFGQGPWTPFQMLAWGAVGFMAAYVPYLKKNPYVQVVYGVFSGVFFSAVMDVWTTVFQESGFTFTRYLAYLSSAIPVTVVYAVSNALFLLVLSPGMRRITDRLAHKYGFVIHSFKKEKQS